MQAVITTDGLRGSGGCFEHREHHRFMVDSEALGHTSHGIPRRMMRIRLIHSLTTSTVFFRRTKSLDLSGLGAHRMHMLRGTTARDGKQTRQSSTNSRIQTWTIVNGRVTLRCPSE